MEIKLSEHEVNLIKEYQKQIEDVGIQNVKRIGELQSLITCKVAARVASEELFQRITA